MAGADDSAILQRGSQFASALDDERKLVSSVTGFKRNDGLIKIFGEEGVEKLEGIATALKNDSELQRLAVLGSQGADRITSELGGKTVINPLHRGLMILNGIIKRGGVVRKESTLNDAAQIFKDPQKLAALLEKANPRELSVLRRLINSIPLEQLTRTVPAITAARQ